MPSAFISLLLLAVLARCVAFSPKHRGASRFFLDTADESDWKELLPTGMFHGVTTNPTILERCKQPCTIENIHRMAFQVLSEYDLEEFMCQSWGSSIEELVENGLKLTKPSRDRIVVKVPVSTLGVKAATQLIRSGCRVCLTACYHHKQALIAASIGAEYIAPYLGRMTDIGKDGVTECVDMQEITDGLGSDTRILVASIREAQTLAQLAEAGLETFTFSSDVARELFHEPLTDEAAAVFEKAARENR